MTSPSETTDKDRKIAYSRKVEECLKRAEDIKREIAEAKRAGEKDEKRNLFAICSIMLH